MSTAAAPAHLSEPPETMVPTPHRVVHRRVEVLADDGSPETVTLALAPLDSALAPPAPGQFAMVWVPGVGEVPISVAGLLAPGSHSGDGTAWELTVRAVGAASAAIVAASDGDVLGLRGPFGRGWSPVPPERTAVVVAGGLGLAPLRLHIESLLAERRDLADPRVTLVVGARSPREVLYPDRLDAWGEHCAVHVTVDRPARGWRGEVGLVTATLARLRLPPDAAAALCGPEIMMRVAAADLRSLGLAPNAVQLSLERSMACAVAHCGRCQIGPVLVCRDGPVFDWATAAPLMAVRRW